MADAQGDAADMALRYLLLDLETSIRRQNQLLAYLNGLGTAALATLLYVLWWMEQHNFLSRVVAG